MSRSRSRACRAFSWLRCTTRRTSSRAYFGTDTARGLDSLRRRARGLARRARPAATHEDSRIALEVAALVGVVVLAVAWTRLDGQSPSLYHGGFLVCGLAATAVIAAAVHPSPGPFRPRPVVRAAVCARPHQLRRVPLPLAHRHRVRREADGLRGMAAASACKPRSRSSWQSSPTGSSSSRFVAAPARAFSGGSSRRQSWSGLVVVLAVSTLGGRSARKIDPLHNPLDAATKAFRSAPPNARRVMIVGDSVALSLGIEMHGLAMSPPVAVFNGAIQGAHTQLALPSARHRNKTGQVATVKVWPCDPDWQAGAIERFRPTDHPLDCQQSRRCRALSRPLARYVLPCLCVGFQRAIQDEIATARSARRQGPDDDRGLPSIPVRRRRSAHRLRQQGAPQGRGCELGRNSSI